MNRLEYDKTLTHNIFDTLRFKKKKQTTRLRNVQMLIFILIY